MVFRSMPSALIEAIRTTPPLLPSRRMANDIAVQQKYRKYKQVNCKKNQSKKEIKNSWNNLTV